MVWIPRIAPEEIDSEGELAMVIGRRLENPVIAEPGRSW